MQGSWEGKQERGSMIIRTSKILFLVGFLLSCEPNLVDDPIPFQSFDNVVINLAFPEFIDLNKDGGFKDISDRAGVRGIIVYRNSPSSFSAFEKKLFLYTQ